MLRGGVGPSAPSGRGVPPDAATAAVYCPGLQIVLHSPAHAMWADGVRPIMTALGLSPRDRACVALARAHLSSQRNDTGRREVRPCQMSASSAFAMRPDTPARPPIAVINQSLRALPQ